MARIGKCKAELQPNNILIGINDKGRLFRKCCFYNNEEELKL